MTTWYASANFDGGGVMAESATLPVIDTPSASTPVPEPSSLVLMVTAIGLLLVLSRRLRKALR